MEEYLTAAEVAKWLNVHYRTIENWKAQEKIESKNGKYGLRSAIAYRIEQLQTELDEIKHDPKNALFLQKLAAEVDERRAIARIKAMEADEKEGKLLNAEEVLVSWQNAIAHTKAKFLAIPAKLALELSGISNPEEIQERLTQVIDEALIEMSNE